MESSSPFDLNEAVAAWRAEARTAGMTEGQVSELEDHLRACFEALQAQGLPAEEAWLLAERRMGKPALLAREYLKVRPERVLTAYLLGAFRRNRAKLIACATFGLLAAGVVYWSQKPSYTSEALLLVRRGDTSPLPGIEPAEDIGTEVQILRSRDLLGQVAAAIGPKKILEGTEPPGRPFTMEAAEAALQRGITVEAVPDSRVLRIRYATEHPAQAQAIVRCVVDSYFREHVDVNLQGGAIGDFLAQETDQLRIQLESTEASLAEVRSKLGGLSVEASLDASAREQVQVRQELLTTEADLAQARSDGSPPSHAAGLKARIDFLTARLASEKQAATTSLRQMQVVHELQRSKELQEANYRYYAQHLEKTRIEAAIGSGGALNVARLQAPTPPQADWSRIRRLMAAFAASGLGLGVALAFLTEILVSRLGRPGKPPPRQWEPVTAAQ